MPTDRVEIFIGPHGSHHGIGSRGYPVRELGEAMRLVRGRRQPGQSAVIWVYPGTYRIPDVLELGPEDSHTTIAALPGGPAVFDGGAELSGWEESEFAGVRVWSAPAPDRPFLSLYVDGARRDRPRFPRQGDLWIDEQAGLDPRADFDGTLLDGSDRFIAAPGDLPELADPTEVEVVVPHYWVQERLPIATIDRATREVVCRRRSILALRDDATKRFARYWLDNVGEAFGEVPGEWYLDASGRFGRGPRLYYAPRVGEELAEVTIAVPGIDAFIRVTGDPGAGRAVRDVRLEGLTFRTAGFAERPAARAPFGVREDGLLPTDVDFGASVQGATEARAAIVFAGARDCVVLDTVVERVDGYAIELGPGTRGALVSGVTIRDAGAGAVRIHGATDPSSADFSRANTVSDTVMSGLGRVYPNAVGVLVQHSADNVISHNEIADAFYTGVSIGWVWDYAPSPSTGNLVAFNHIHDLGQRRLNDMGGIYLLGIAPGTVVRGNHVHDVRARNYGGWGIYLDQGSSHVVVEGNVVHDCSHQAFHVNYGRENIVRHNVFAYGGEAQVAITRPEAHRAFTFQRNIVVGRGTPAFAGRLDHRRIDNVVIDSDLNLIWDEAPVVGAVFAGNGGYDAEMTWALLEGADEVWRRLGYDRHSTVADPGFRDAAARDLRVHPGGPAEPLDIEVPDAARAGVRPEAERTHPFRLRTLPDGAGGAELTP